MMEIDEHFTKNNIPQMSNIMPKPWTNDFGQAGQLKWISLSHLTT